MKIDVEIEWLIDDAELNIKSGKRELVPVDIDYIEDEQDLVAGVEFYLECKYGVCMHRSWNSSDDGDFVIDNVEDVLTQLN